MPRTLLLALAAFVMLLARPAHADDTLAAVRSRGQLICGVGGNNPPFSSIDSKGQILGIDVDFCRVIAASVFGDAAKVQFRPLTAINRFTALQSGEVDVLFNSSTWVMSREATLGLQVAAVNYYGGMGLLVHKELGVSHAPELSGATVCIAPGSTNELNLSQYSRRNGGSFTPVVIENSAELLGAFKSGRCDAWAQDAISLAAVRQASGGDASGYVLLPEALSMEPLGAFVRSNDARWFNVVRWSILVTVAAEQAGVTRENVDTIPANSGGDAQAVSGGVQDLGKSMGLDARFAHDAIKQVGNYGQIWNANIGVLGVDRGLNKLWNAGGLMYSPPVR